MQMNSKAEKTCICFAVSGTAWMDSRHISKCSREGYPRDTRTQVLAGFNVALPYRPYRQKVQRTASRYQNKETFEQHFPFDRHLKTLTSIAIVGLFSLNANLL